MEASRQPSRCSSGSPVECCPACGSDDWHSCYRIEQIPAHSVLLMESQDEARNYPGANLELAVCHGCGFLFNRLFDSTLNDYGPTYEETQHFSPTFRGFVSSLCDCLINDFDVRDKTVLEIGCGKGEFLAELCLRGDNRGIGIDPASAPDRLPAAARQRLEFLPELYGPQHAELSADVICCRHTLEHIGPVRAFLADLRKSLGSRRSTLLFFEVPAAEPIIDECRFWDVYYEHCSYFSELALRTLFERTGFQVLRCERAYGGQYLLLFARPADPSTEGEVEPCRDGWKDRVRHFRESVQLQRDCWSSQLTAPGRRIAIWGAGSKCVAFLSSVDCPAASFQIVDINPYKQQRYLPGTGHRVIAPQELVDSPPDTVIVMNPNYLEEIETCLESLGLRARCISLHSQSNQHWHPTLDGAA